MVFCGLAICAQGSEGCVGVWARVSPFTLSASGRCWVASLLRDESHRSCALVYEWPRDVNARSAAAVLCVTLGCNEQEASFATPLPRVRDDIVCALALNGIAVV